MEDIARVCAQLTKLGGSLINDLTDSDLAASSGPHGKTAGWLLGHLCITGDFVRRKCGRAPLTPKEWGPKFNMGTQPSSVASDYPPMGELRSAFEKVYADLAAMAPTISAEVLAGATPFEPARARFPTMGAFATCVMTGHLGYHLGQLSGWRVARNK